MSDRFGEPEWPERSSLDDRALAPSYGHVQRVLVRDGLVGAGRVGALAFGALALGAFAIGRWRSAGWWCGRSGSGGERSAR
jgi:hypothetical protein